MIFGPKFLTLTFTDTSIKLAAIKPNSKGVKISFLAKRTLPPATVFNGQIINENTFREVLKSFYFEISDQLKTNNLIVGLNEQETFVTTARFERKPKDAKKQITDFLAPRLPFDVSSAAIRFKALPGASYQIASTRSSQIQLLSGIFEAAGFSVRAIVPVTLTFPTLIGKQKDPYLFISSDEDLVFSLVVGNEVVFTYSTKFKEKVGPAEKEILKVAGEIIKNEYTPLNDKPLSKVYVHGSSAEIIKSFFANQGFSSQVVAPVKSNQHPGYDIAEFSRNIALAFYNENILSFQKVIQDQKNKTSSIQSKTKSSFGILLGFILLATAISAGAFFFWPVIKDNFFGKPSNQPSKNQNIEDTSQKQKVASPSTEKVASPSPEKKTDNTKVINKQGYKIFIQNGSGKVGAAGEAKDFLTSKGYQVIGTDNADKFDYQKSIIRLKSSKDDILELLTKDLKERYSIDVGSGLAASESYDVLIIIGSQ